MDYNFWKDRYKDSWNKAAKKEKMVIELIESRTGQKVELCGLGAGSNDYLSGSASDYNFTKGDADLHIEDSDFFIEVTGPNIKVNPSDALWIRPDKIQNALKKMEKGIGKGHFIIHVIERKDNSQTMLRVIPISPELMNFPTIHPSIRGTRETYKEIPATYDGIISIEDFVAMVLNRYNKKLYSSSAFT
ncbi:hypothetical protein [Alistipes indistinctus]|uniref:Uncharacterized protein n=1 Tax=Alistipes indistinctus YIT 12060 TaxID=742725 RepID=G5HBD3_9BACT|nr:hypothetical protein [Alistipes indistinctus]EHB91899.1 hypothetical protein HMPREF9450_01948 [Alistipes indistinctus YIT 12060]UWN59651.1 hypothetical protein NQ495_01485 [Alistipes indistinctus YIT 12060]